MHTSTRTFVASCLHALLLTSTTSASPTPLNAPLGDRSLNEARALEPALSLEAEYAGIDKRSQDDILDEAFDAGLLKRQSVQNDLSLTYSAGLKNGTLEGRTMYSIPLENGTVQPFLLNAARFAAGQTNEDDPQRQIPATDYLRYSNANLSLIVQPKFGNETHAPLDWKTFVDLVSFASSNLYARWGNTSWGGTVLLQGSYKNIGDWYLCPSLGDQNYTGKANTSLASDLTSPINSTTSGGGRDKLRRRRSSAPALPLEKRAERLDPLSLEPIPGTTAESSSGSNDGRGRKLGEKAGTDSSSTFYGTAVPLPKGTRYNMSAALSTDSSIPYSLMHTLARTAYTHSLVDCPYDKTCKYYQYSTTIPDDDLDGIPGTGNAFQLKMDSTSGGIERTDLNTLLEGLVKVGIDYSWGTKTGTRAALYGRITLSPSAQGSGVGGNAAGKTLGWWSLGTEIGYNYEEGEGEDGVQDCTPTGQRGGETDVKGCFLRKVEYQSA